MQKKKKFSSAIIPTTKRNTAHTCGNQFDALDALWKAVHEGCDIPLEAPETKWAYDYECAAGKFKGFMNHFHCSKKKIDVAGLDIESRLKGIK